MKVTRCYRGEYESPECTYHYCDEPAVFSSINSSLLEIIKGAQPIQRSLCSTHNSQRVIDNEFDDWREGIRWPECKVKEVEI